MPASIETEHEIELVSVGIDIGSATSHLVFSRLVMQKYRSRFVTVRREVLHQSPIRLTPYVDGTLVDGAALAEFFEAQYPLAGLRPEDVQTGALILTGVALLRHNARQVAQAVSHAAGKLVAVSAGDTLEAVTSAYGSGAVELSSRGSRVLNIDVGGGTTKLALCLDGRVDSVTTLDVGARLVVTDGDANVVRLEDAGRDIAASIGVTLELGRRADPGEIDRLAQTMADEVLAALPLGQTTTASRLLRGEALSPDPVASVVMFSGGVAEYVYGRQGDHFGDLGGALARYLQAGMQARGVPIAVSESGIRATVIGAGQHTAQVSGSTIYVTDESVLPLRDLPVMAPKVEFIEELSADDVAASVEREIRQSADTTVEEAVAIAFDWDGSATYDRLHAFSTGLDRALRKCLPDLTVCVLVCTQDIGGLIGEHLAEEVGAGYAIVAIDCIELSAFDFIDVGQPLPRSNALPLIIKSLVFSASAAGGTVEQASLSEAAR